MVERRREEPDVGQREAGIVDDDDDMREALGERTKELETRRALLHGYVQHDGWTWDAVYNDVDAEEDDPERTG